MNVYFISGLGANHKAFKNLKIPSDFNPLYIEWKVPQKNESLEHYVERLSENIDFNNPFYLVGLSFGGIVAQELQRFVTPEKIILISTIKNRNQMPRYMKFSAKFSPHKAIPMSFFTSNNTLSYRFFRNLYDPGLPTFDEFFTHKDPYYLSWAINEIVNWQPKEFVPKKLYQLHGSKDIVFPIKNFSRDEVDVIEGGSHIMVLQKHKEVTRKLIKYLKE